MKWLESWSLRDGAYLFTATLFALACWAGVRMIDNQTIKNGAIEIPVSESKISENISLENKLETFSPTKDVLIHFDEQLTKIFEHKGARISRVYKIDEGEPLKGSVGIYVVGVLPNGDILWLVQSFCDRGPIDTTIIEALIFLPKKEWDKECKKAKRNGLSLPVVRLYQSSNYIQLDRENFIVKGEYFVDYRQ